MRVHLGLRAAETKVAQLGRQRCVEQNIGRTEVAVNQRERERVQEGHGARYATSDAHSGR